MGEAIGARSIDLEWVQVHPTGLVEPDDPEAKIKFLAAEALRGVGGLVINANGERFCNELGRRGLCHWWDVEVQSSVQTDPEQGCFRWDHLALQALHRPWCHEILRDRWGSLQGHEHPLSTLEATHQAHFEAAKKQEKDPNGGPFEAYPSGKTWDWC